MRVLCNSDVNPKISSTFEIIDIGYVEDIGGFYFIPELQKVSGLCMEDGCKNIFFIRNVDRTTCNDEICIEILNHGFIDLRKYGSYEYLEKVE